MLIDESARYVRSIRNVSKRGYAEHYRAYLIAVSCLKGGADRPDLIEPDWQNANLSYMGAQAVRMRLAEYFR